MVLVVILHAQKVGGAHPPHVVLLDLTQDSRPVGDSLA